MRVQRVNVHEPLSYLEKINIKRGWDLREDLFWRQEPGVDLSVRSEPDWQHGLRLYQAYDRESGVR